MARHTNTNSVVLSSVRSPETAWLPLRCYYELAGISALGVVLPSDVRSDTRALVAERAYKCECKELGIHQAKPEDERARFRNQAIACH
jgi:hypothetical protein